jgi:hypothetical protein
MSRGSAHKIVTNSWISSLKLSFYFILFYFIFEIDIAIDNVSLHFDQNRAVIGMHGVWQYNGPFEFMF